MKTKKLRPLVKMMKMIGYTYNVRLVGKKISADYEGQGCHTGVVKYYNTKLDMYLLEFVDGSEDLIRGRL